MGNIESIGKKHKQAERYYKAGLEQVPKGLLPHRFFVFSYNLALLYMDALGFTYVKAEPYLESMIHNTQLYKSPMEKICILGLVSRYFYHTGKYELSAELFGAVMFADDFYGGVIYTKEDFNIALEGLEQHFGKDECDKLLNTGKRHSLEEAIIIAKKNFELEVTSSGKASL